MKTCISNLRLALLPLALAAAFPSFAQTQATPQLRETVVTANRSEQLLTEALPYTTVIGRDMIDRSQAVDLPTLLSSEAGFQFTQNGGPGTASNVFLRGSAGLQVLVLIDGVALTKQDTTGTVSLEHIMLDQIERVEIVRGNVSAIYGSGAIGGVIQIFTRKGQGKPTGFARLEVGSYGSVRASTGVSGQFGDTRFSLGVGRHKTNGFSAMDVTQFPNENPDADGYRNTNYNFGISHDLAKGHTLGLRAQGSDGKFEFDGGGFGTPTDIFVGRSTLATWSLYSHNKITSDWRSELTYSQGRERSVSDGSLAVFPFSSEAITRSRTLNWTNFVAVGSWLLTVGGERQRQSIDATDSTPTQLNRERGVTALFAGLAGTFGPNSVQLNARRDAADGLTAKTTGYVGYGFQFTPEWKLIGSVSSAFNLPPLGYLFDPFFGNPALQPETARSAEIGVQWAQDGQVLRATSFRTRTSNLLQFDPATSSFNNVANASNKGLEVSYSGKLSRTDLRGSLTVQNPTDDATGQRLIRRGRTMASFGASVPLGQWTVGGDLRYTGARPDMPANPSLPAYTVANLTTRYALTPEVALTARIDNLFDRRYQTAYGFNQSGRAAYVGIVWTQK
ncbi:MAG: TonB-dependent receptor plug domain-containing protein [Polaromonas sp.]